MPWTASSRMRGMLARAAAWCGGLLEQDCLLCGAPAGDAPVCDDCTRDLPRLPNTCPCCALPSPGGDPCGRCLARPPSYDATVAAWAYAFPADRLVHALKYRARLALAPWFARLLAPHVRALRDVPHLIVAVPLHRSRLAERGFNQAHEVARRLARLTGIPLVAGAATRLRATAPQAGLGIAERRSNLQSAFHCTGCVEGRSVLVVDDVMTTGATLDALARALKRAGAVRVTNAVVARTLEA